jgi:hypothetical protein
MRDFIQDYLVKEFGGGPADRATIRARLVEPETADQSGGTLAVHRGATVGRYSSASVLTLAATACLVGLFVIGTTVFHLNFGSLLWPTPITHDSLSNSQGSVGQGSVNHGSTPTRNRTVASTTNGGIFAASNTNTGTGTSAGGSGGGSGGGKAPGNVVSNLVLTLGATLNTAVTGLTTTLADTADGSTNLAGTVNGVTGTVGSTLTTGVSGIGSALQL